MRSAKIKVYFFGTDEGRTYPIEIDNTLDALQGLVGGYIETTSLLGLLKHGIIMVCNETGLLDQLDVNENTLPFFFVGNVFFTAYDEGDFVSLTDDQIRVIDKFFKL